ncbi:MAG: hypothetical protein U1E36_05870 [Rickettsiales bacterium]
MANYIVHSEIQDFKKVRETDPFQLELKKDPLKQAITLLQLADNDYLSARILLLNGLWQTGIPKANEVIEKVLKAILILRAVELDQLEKLSLKSYYHDTPKLFEELKKYLNIKEGDFQRENSILSNYYLCYERRYENWLSHGITCMDASVNSTDRIYTFLRNFFVSKIPDSLREEAKVFGFYLSPLNSYEKNHPERRKINNLKEQNAVFSALEINQEKLEKLL